MKKRYFTSLFAGILALGAMAQTQFKVLEDMTSKLQNADFKTGSPVEYTIRTYDYDIADQLGVGNGGEGLFGQQEVPGWTAANPSDNKWMAKDTRTDGSNARAAGIFAYDSESMIGLGGDYFPRLDGGDTQGLGMVAVWGASLQYSQNITLPAGDYLLIARLCNVAGDGTIDNHFGFKTSDDTYYNSKMTNVPIMAVLEGEGKDIWVEDTVIIRLAAETAGDVILGYSYGAGSGTAPHIFLDNVKLLKVDPSTLDQLQIEAARADLQKLIDEGKRLGVDTSASEAMLANPNATLDQLSDAIVKQQELNAEGITDLSEFFLMNAHFSQDDPVEGGICTYAKDKATNNVNYSGMQSVKSWVANHLGADQYASGVYATGSDAFLGGKAFVPPTTMSDGSTGKVLGFVTCWTGSIQYTQHVTLPAGSYTLEISYYNTGGTGAVSKNLIGFVEDNGTEHLGTTTTFPVGQWGKEKITFELAEETDGYFTLGYTSPNVSSNDMPHFFLDGISLFYEGALQFDPSLFALKGVVTSAENLEGETFNADLQADFQDAINEARALISTQSDDAEANKAAQEKITAMIQEVQSSIDAYKRLENFYNKDLNNAEQKYTYITQLLELDNEVSDALSNCNWDNAKIDEVIASLPGIIKDGVQKAFDAAVASGEKLAKDLDISPLFNTLGVTYSTSAVQGTNVPDKQWNYGNASNFKTQHGTSEVWNQSPFTVSQTLADMPAGTYTITTRAFYRISDQVSNYDSYIGGETMPSVAVLAGHNRGQIVNVAELASETAEDFANSSEVAGGGLFVPNSQLAAHDIFENPDYAEKVTVSARTALAQKGDLTFGITADELMENSWVVWYTFEIAYNALDESVLSEELVSLIDEATDARDSYEASSVAATYAALEEAIAKGEKAQADATTEAITSAIVDLAAAIEMNKRSAQLIDEFNRVATVYLEKTSNEPYTSTDTELNEILEKTEQEFTSNEEIQDLIDRLPSAYFKHVVTRSDFAQGTEDNPIDITDIITNPDFEVGNSSGWTITAENSEDEKIGKNQGYQGSSYTNADGDITISKFIEAWRPTTAEDAEPVHLEDGTISQVLNGVLPQGYYRLEIDGYATHQQAVPAEGITGVDLYVAIDGGLMRTPIGIDVTNGNPTHFVRDFYSNGTSVATIGIMVKDTNASWLAADNFKLSFIGQQTPDAVDAVKVADAPAAVYTVAGTRTSQLVKGLNIVVRDGKAQKVLVK